MSGSKYSLSSTCFKLVHKVFEKYSKNIFDYAKKLRLGIGAKCTVNFKYLQPANIMSETYPEKTAHVLVENLLVIKQDTRQGNKSQQSVVIFFHDDFNTAVVYCVKQWSKITNEGSEENLFERNQIVSDIEGAGADAEYSVPIDSTTVRSGNHSDDIVMVKKQGLMVDDDNDPAPENIPDVTTTRSSTTNGKWGWNGQCHQKLIGAHNL